MMVLTEEVGNELMEGDDGEAVNVGDSSLGDVDEEKREREQGSKEGSRQLRKMGNGEGDSLEIWRRRRYLGENYNSSPASSPYLQ